MSQSSKTIKGLRVMLDRLVYFHEPDKLKEDAEHEFLN